MENEFLILKAMDNLAQVVNCRGARQVAVISGQDLEVLRDFVDTFTDGEDPEDNPLAGKVMEICERCLQ